MKIFLVVATLGLILTIVLARRRHEEFVSISLYEPKFKGGKQQ